jgi:hypothetical protein
MYYNACNSKFKETHLLLHRIHLKQGGGGAEGGEQDEVYQAVLFTFNCN